ncbi:hypothetical protein DERP_006261 [Dermatophagoides pteronyssinus]|uniref:Uncharacterized protein n=1 Tax=Dermatophagoides pteronyssinus TaxID=6956 RepID=A0ABQ8IYI6_DERPT|nr:hypothetical protein DERP_006261 [Dermatophagoides pteronyssinus]
MTEIIKKNFISSLASTAAAADTIENIIYFIIIGKLSLLLLSFSDRLICDRTARNSSLPSDLIFINRNRDCDFE